MPSKVDRFDSRAMASQASGRRNQFVSTWLYLHMMMPMREISNTFRGNMINRNEHYLASDTNLNITRW